VGSTFNIPAALIAGNLVIGESAAFWGLNGVNRSSIIIDYPGPSPFADRFGLAGYLS
jgi:hypothetical protein